MVLDENGAGARLGISRGTDPRRTPVKVLGVCGSLQAKSANLSLLLLAATKMPAGVELVFFDGLRDLPPFNPDLEPSDVPAVAAWRRALAVSDALLIASPEYGFSLPGALKNAIDWVIGTGELEGKVVGVTASTPGPAERGRRGLLALTDTLAAVSAKIVGGEPIVRGPAFERELGQLIAALVAKARE